MAKIELTDGSPVPEDRSHTRLKPNGQQEGYIVLSDEERAKGFVKPVRKKYLHTVCGAVTTMGTKLAETYAVNPRFYSGTFCCSCSKHFPLNQFTWEPDGEPMDPDLQEEWAKGAAERARQARKEKRDRLNHYINLKYKEIAELTDQIAKLDAEGT